MTPEQAIEEYKTALVHTNQNLENYDFMVDNGRVRIGHKCDWGVQWSMMYYTPEEVMKLAKMRKLDLKSGDPKKPHWS